jgi:predicted nucleic acid-binding protein
MKYLLDTNVVCEATAKHPDVTDHFKMHHL